MLEVLAVFGVALLGLVVVFLLPVIGFAGLFLLVVWSDPRVQHLTTLPNGNATGIGVLASILSIALMVVALVYNGFCLSRIIKSLEN